MSYSAEESTVSLEHLDDHLKVILKLKLREFVHLSPWFRNIPSLDTTYYPKALSDKSVKSMKLQTNCPNRHSVARRRRPVRVVLV